MKSTYFFLKAVSFLSMLISRTSAWEQFELGSFCAKVDGEMKPLAAISSIYPEIRRSALSYGDPYARPVKFSYVDDTFETTYGTNPGKAGFFNNLLVTGPHIKGEKFFLDDQLEILHTFYSCPSYNPNIRFIATKDFRSLCFEVPVYFRPHNELQRLIM